MLLLFFFVAFDPAPKYGRLLHLGIQVERALEMLDSVFGSTESGEKNLTENEMCAIPVLAHPKHRFESVDRLRTPFYLECLHSQVE